MGIGFSASLQMLEEIGSSSLKVFMIKRLMFCNFRAVVTLLDRLGLLPGELVEVELPVGIDWLRDIRQQGEKNCISMSLTA